MSRYLTNRFSFRYCHYYKMTNIRYCSSLPSPSVSPLHDREFLWESEMIQFWESLKFNKYHINVLINLGHGKYIDKKLLSSNNFDLNKFAEYSLEQCRHLRSEILIQRHLQNIQKLFPNMILNKAIYYNPYFLTLTLPTMEKRKCDLIDLISTHLSQETNPNKYDYLFKAKTSINNDNNNKIIINNEYLNKSDIIELIDWDKLFENVSVYLTKDFGEIIKQIHILRKLLCVNYKNNMGLSQIEFIELFEIYPNILRSDYLSFMAKFRFLMEFASPGILNKKKVFFSDEIDLTLIGNEDKYSSEISFTSYENMLTDERIKNGYQLMLKYLISNGWIFNYSWNRLSRIKYWDYNKTLRKKYSIQEIIKMNTSQFLTITDKCWKEYCAKNKKSYSQNIKLDENWRDNQQNIDRFMDYEEFIKNELRQYLNIIILWNNNDINDTKLLLKKNKTKLRSPFIDKYSKNIQQIQDENSFLNAKTFTLIEKEQYKTYLNKIQRLEKFLSRLNRTIYSPTNKDSKNFLKNPNDFGFNYLLKYESLNIEITEQDEDEDEDKDKEQHVVM